MRTTRRARIALALALLVSIAPGCGASSPSTGPTNPPAQSSLDEMKNSMTNQLKAKGKNRPNR